MDGECVLTHSKMEEDLSSKRRTILALVAAIDRAAIVTWRLLRSRTRKWTQG